MKVLIPPATTSTPDGAVLHLEGDASARPALILHGLGYASWAAADLRDHLAPHVGLWSLDHRGTGRSSRGEAPITIGQLAADAASVLERIGMPFPVIGYSMGGYVAQLLALARPDLVSSLVLLATSAGGATATPVPTLTAAAWAEAASGQPDEYAAQTMPLSFRVGWPDTHADHYKRVLDARLVHPTTQSVWREQYKACEHFLSTGYDPSRLALPVLILHGTDDRVVPVENGRALHHLLSQSRYREVDHAGHLLHIEQADFVATEILQYLSTTHQPNMKE